jgi:hypothetical protein
MAKNTNDNSNINSLFVATPCYGDVDHQFHLSTINLAGECFQRGVANHNFLVASSIVSQGRNICVSEFLNNRRFDNMLFVDADIKFDAETAFTLLNSPYDITLVPYPVKHHFWDKSKKALKNHPDGLSKILGNKYSLRRAPKTEIIDDAWMEVEHGPTGFMLIRRKVFEAIIEKKPNLRINKEIFTQSGMQSYMNLYNFFDFKFNAKSGKYTGEDFNFCKLARSCGFKIHAYLNDYIAHCGRHEFTGRYRDEFIYDFSS